jgi:small subunit ribosomal protein S20
MPVIKSAQKQVRSSARRRVSNLRRRKTIKAAYGKVVETPSKETLSVAFKALDKAAQRGTIHPKKAARLKSRLSKKVK